MAPTCDRLLGDATKNKNGGYYKNGDAYTYPQKVAVVSTFFDMWQDAYPERPTFSAVARKAKVSRMTAKKYIEEFELLGNL